MLGQPLIDSELSSQLKNPYPDGMPILRIGLIEHRDSVEFRLTGRFSVVNAQGISILKDVASSVKWRVKIAHYSPAKYIYHILLGKFQDRYSAQELEYKLIEKGIGNRIKAWGGKLYYNDQVVNDNTQFWVVVDHLNSENEAQAFAKQRLSEFSYQISKEKIHEPHALFELFDSDFEKLGESENVIRIVPESPEVLTYIYDSIGESELQNRPLKYRCLSGPLEFRCTDEGRIIIICELPLEKYVESVVALDVKSGLPAEVVQAQTVAVRSKTIASLGIKHQEDTFHLCSSAHCQVFNGLIQTSDAILKSVRETFGNVLWDGRQVIDANYSSVCGGFTEAYHTLQQDRLADPYPPVFCGNDKNHNSSNLDFASHSRIDKWIREVPGVYCNLAYLPSSKQVNYLLKHFRWHIYYDRQELEEIISTKVGFDIGVLFDIIPIRRGSSGRIFEIEILASNKNILLAGEQKICLTLSIERLPSSCFVVDRQFDEEGFPLAFVFYGAGAGHGVGLCLAGGVTMAFQGKKYTEILAHYFRGVEIKKIY